MHSNSTIFADCPQCLRATHSVMDPRRLFLCVLKCWKGNNWEHRGSYIKYVFSWTKCIQEKHMSINITWRWTFLLSHPIVLPDCMEPHRVTCGHRIESTWVNWVNVIFEINWRLDVWVQLEIGFFRMQTFSSSKLSLRETPGGRLLYLSSRFLAGKLDGRVLLNQSSEKHWKPSKLTSILLAFVLLLEALREVGWTYNTFFPQKRVVTIRETVCSNYFQIFFAYGAGSSCSSLQCPMFHGFEHCQGLILRQL